MFQSKPLDKSKKMASLPRQQRKEDRIIGRQVLDETSLKKMIREMHLKVTDQRLLILKALYSGREHVTAQEVYEIVSLQDSSIGFATVYRFLRKLTEHHFVTEVRMGGLPARYEITPQSHHDHLTCTQCGKICEFENELIEKLQQQIASEFGYKLTDHVLELYGVCSDCQEAQ